MAKDNKTVAITMRFWTNDLEVKQPSSRKDKVAACWDSGMMIMEGNKTKGIPRLGPQPFNCPEDIIPLMKELFRKSGIIVASSNSRPRVLSHKRRAK